MLAWLRDYGFLSSVRMIHLNGSDHESMSISRSGKLKRLRSTEHYADRSSGHKEVALSL